MLYNKYRPKSLEEFIGNEVVVESLSGLISDNNRPHFYILSGTHGVGKTTLARIFGNMLDLEVYEENASDNNGVDFAREFIKRLSHKGFGKGNLYIIDEAHRLTKDAQNILLKGLEEPPKHSYIIMCTTEPDALLPTTKSRATKYTLRNPDRGSLLARLQLICKEEGIDTDNKVLDQIIRTSYGCPRDSIVLLENIKHVEYDRQLEVVTSFSFDMKESIDLCRALLKPNVRECLKILTLIKEPAEKVRRTVMSYMAKVLTSNHENVIAYKVLNHFQKISVNDDFAGIVLAILKALKGE